MDFRLSDETLEWQRYCRRFAREVMRPAAPLHDREESVPYEVINAAYEWKLTGLDWLGSLQSDPEGLKGVIYAEELHWGCAGIALAISASALCAAGIASSGTPEQIGRWIPEVVGSKGNPRLGAYAVTEPSAGSDVKSLRTTAKRDGDDWILNGTKTFISNGGIADVTVVVATVDPDLGHRGQASFVVTGDNPGLKLGHKESKLGIRASQTAEIVLEDCRVPGDALLGGDEKLQRKLERARSGQRSKASGALATFEITRPTVGASALGIAQAAYEWTLEHLWDRTDEGRPLLQEQRIQQVLADVATEIESARLLVWRAAWMGRNGVPMTGGQGSMSKLKGGDVAMWATTELMDLVGPEAQSTEYPLEKWFRDAKIYQLFEGTAQIQRLVIARMQTAEYAERLEFAKDVAAQAQTNGSMNGPWWRRRRATLCRRARRRGDGEGCRLEAASGRGVRLAGIAHHHGHHHAHGSTPVAPATGAAWPWRWGSTSSLLVGDRRRRAARRLARPARRRGAPRLRRRGDRNRPDSRATRRGRPDAGADLRPPAQRGARCARQRRAAAGRGGADRGRGAQPPGRSAGRRRGGACWCSASSAWPATSRRPGCSPPASAMTSTSRACCATPPPTRSARSA